MNTTRSYKFPKSEKMCNVREISALFKGESLFVYPFKVGYKIKTKEEDDLAMKVLCSVGKKYSKSAVKRNLIKRRIREAYRLNRHIFTESVEAGASLAFIYVSQKEESYEQINKSMVKAMQKLAELCKESSNNDSSHSN